MAFAMRATVLCHHIEVKGYSEWGSQGCPTVLAVPGNSPLSPQTICSPRGTSAVSSLGQDVLFSKFTHEALGIFTDSKFVIDPLTLLYFTRNSNVHRPLIDFHREINK